MSNSPENSGEEKEIAGKSFKLANDHDGPPTLKRNLSCVSWNVQSIRNKCAEVLEHIVDYDADVVYVTETWMEAEKNDITG